MATTIGNLITLDGEFTDWRATDFVERPGNTVANYQVYGALVDDATGKNYVVGINAAVATDPVIAANTSIYLNTDQNAATGYLVFGSAIGVEYEVKFLLDATNELQPYLYSRTSAGTETLLNSGAPLKFGVSSDGESVEVAIPQTLLTPTGGPAPTSINFAALINNAVALPGDFTNPQYVITDPSTLVPVDHTIKKVGIVFSATTAALYFGGGEAGKTAYADLFMAAQHQAAAAGVSYDLLTEADLTNVAKLSQYSALIFPDMENVKSEEVASIVSALSHVVYDYHVPIITAGNFLTNDQYGVPLPGNSYANMQALLDVTLGGFGTATYSVTADPAALANHNPIMAGYEAGELIGGASGQFAGTTAGYYTNTGYQTFSGVTQPATVLADINIQGGAAVAGVVQTTTGGTNTVFATTGLLGDSNLLQHAIQNAVFGTTPSLSLNTSRMAGVVASRTDLDQSQFRSDVSPEGGQAGIYDLLIPILQQWKQQYNFVGTYYANIGDNANPNNENFTNWDVSAPYYRSIIAMGSEIGNHSYTHLINAPVSTWNENTNTLYVTPPANGSAPNWTFDYEFGQSKTILEQQLGITIAGAAVPGATETVGTSQQIMQYYQTVAGGLTGYVTGGWTGVGSGYPNAFGYIDPTNTGSVYIAPNITFDFTEIQFQNKTPEQALADWQALFNQLSANSQAPIIVWPWHDYGATNWDSNGAGGDPGYTTQMFTDFIAYAYNAGYEFVTMETLAARIAAQQKATISETTNGNVITATITPDPTAPDLGGMALNVINGAPGQVIQNAGSWYAYDSDSIFLPYGGGTFNVTLGATQDDVTHIDALPMRADLLSVTGDGANLAFSMTGDGVVDIHVKTPGANVVSIQGAPSATLNGSDLSLAFNDGLLAISSSSPQGVPVQHNVTISDGAVAVTSAGADIVFGGSANDTINGAAGNDTLEGSTGNNVLIGGLGIDTVSYEHATAGVTVSLALTTAQNTIGAGTDTLTTFENLTGSASDDLLTGSTAANVLTGGAGNDVLNGGIGADALIGGTGNDTYVVDNAGDVADETGGDGTDLVQSSITFSLSDAVHAKGTIENLTLIGVGNVNATGNAGDNFITGNTGNNILAGLGGADTLDGGAGIDTASYLASAAAVDVSLATGTAHGGDAEGDTFINIENLTGSSFNDTLEGSTGNNVLIGGLGIDTVSYEHATAGVTVSLALTTAQNTIGAGTDTLTTFENLTGSASDDLLTGSTAANVLTGGAGNDVLNGGIGADALIGGTGNDTYVVDNAGDVADETGGDGTDLVQSSITFSLSDAVHAKGTIENLTLIGVGNVNATGNAGDNFITGNTGNNILAGLGGADTLDGGAGIDTASYLASAAAVDVSLATGTAHGGDAEGDTFINIENLTGSSFNDTLEGSTGNNVLIGGLGIDTVSYEHATAGVTVSLALTTAQNTIGAGTDTLTTFENLTGSASDDLLTGSTAANVLTGGAGNDVLNGGIGADALIGGTGNDTYVVDNAGDVADETGGDGTDLVQSSITFSLSDAVHAKGTIENLTLIGVGNVNATGNAGDNFITGNTGNNILAGLGGADTLDGGAGIDTASYLASAAAVDVSLATGTAHGGDAEGDTFINIENLTGSSFNDTLEGSTGNNVLIGGLGIDTVSYEHATAGVTVSLALTTAQNTIGAGTDTLTTFENLTGSASDDLLTGSTAANVLTGGAGNDVLNGGIGADALIGGTGNDTYVVDNAGDVADETGGDGTDLVQSSITFSLSDAVHAKGTIENVTLTGAGAINATGNAADNAITGNTGANILDGGAGIDVLTGGAGNDTLIGGAGNDRLSGNNGADTFVFAPVNATTTNGIYNAGFGSDVITDFTANMTNASHDFLHLSSSMFVPGTTATALFDGTAHNAAGGLVTVVQQGSNVLITLDPTDTITLNNVTLSVLKASATADIHFV